MSRRVVSLLPAATEMVCALGAVEDLVGISHECDFPESVRSRRVVTRSRISNASSSGAIDAEVRRLLKNALSIYEVDEPALAELRPDVIVTQDLCEVCAVSLEDVRSAVARIAAKDSIDVVSLQPSRLADVFDDIERVATALGREARGAELVRSLAQRIAAIAQRARHSGVQPRVVSVEWIEPLMLGGTWMPELIEAAGGVALGVSAGAPAPTLTRDELSALAPDVVVVKPCGFGLPRALEERATIEHAIVSAVPRARVYVCDGNAFFNRPGPRLVESLEVLAACVHPALFSDFTAAHRASFVELSPAKG